MKPAPNPLITSLSSQVTLSRNNLQSVLYLRHIRRSILAALFPLFALLFMACASTAKTASNQKAETFSTPTTQTASNQKAETFSTPTTQTASNQKAETFSTPTTQASSTRAVESLTAGTTKASSTRAEETRSALLLQQELEALIRDFNGEAGVYVRNLTTGEEIMVNPDTLYPTASMVKVPIMGKLFQDMEDGKFAYDDQVPYDTVYSYRFSEDMINRMPHGSPVSLNRLIYLMVCMSDNTSSIWMQAKAGGGLGINAWLAGNGFEQIRVNSRTEGRGDDFRMYGWGQATPREMTELMVRIFDGKLVSPLASDKMYRIMKGNMWDTDGLSQIPPYINYASKGGAVRRARSETIVVNAPSGDYAWTVMTKNQEDERYDYDNEGYVLKRTIGGLLWNYFEPDHDWQPHPDYPKTW